MGNRSGRTRSNGSRSRTVYRPESVIVAKRGVSKPGFIGRRTQSQLLNMTHLSLFRWLCRCTHGRSASRLVYIIFVRRPQPTPLLMESVRQASRLRQVVSPRTSHLRRRKSSRLAKLAAPVRGELVARQRQHLMRNRVFSVLPSTCLCSTPC